ncbi:MAG: isochorismate synthase [Alicyclobacillaceae bacterium]|nr:isochorismate synthase [Alicyclobacillaceae bacterium]
MYRTVSSLMYRTVCSGLDQVIRRRWPVRAASAEERERVVVPFSCPLQGAKLEDLLPQLQQEMDQMYLFDPLHKMEFLALGTFAETSYTGHRRFHQLEQDWQERSARVTRLAPCRLFALPAFSFVDREDAAGWSNWPDALLRIPRLQLVASGDRLEATLWLHAAEAADVALGKMSVCALLQGDLRSFADLQTVVPWRFLQVESRAEWEARVSAVTRTLRDGLEKVVLARLARHPVQRRPCEAVAALRQRYASSWTFAVARAGAWFVGASPERLLSVEDRRFEVDALAGTRGRGATVQEDTALAEELMASGKDREEHAAVVRFLESQLMHVVRALSVPPHPHIVKYANVQHLFTPVSGDMADGVQLADMLATLHPTPAVAGLPRQAALSLLLETEPWTRGWYAGGVGWMDDRGDGSFAVALRSALYQEGEIAVFAGAGIVPASEPQAEWAETEMKMQPMRDAFGVFQTAEMDG